MPGGTPYLFVGFDADAGFTWMSIILPNGILIGKPSEIIHSDPQSREPVISKIKRAQEMCPLGNRCLLGSTGIYHIPLLCSLHGKDFDCVVINPIITKSSINVNIRELYNDKSDPRKAVRADLDTSLKASIVLDSTIIDLRNLVCDYYYFRGPQSVIALKPHAKLKVSFSAYLNVFNKVTAQASLKLLEAYSLVMSMPAIPKDELVETTHSMAHPEETYALTRYDTICTTAKDATVFGHAPPSNALRIKLYIEVYREHQARLDSILEELHQAVGKLEGTPGYDCIPLIQTLHDVGLLNAVVLTVEAGPFNLFSSLKELYAYFGLDPGVNDSGKFHGGRAYMSKWGLSLVGYILYMVVINNLEVDKVTKMPINPVIYDCYTRKCVSRKKSAVVGTVTHKIYNIISAMSRDNKSFKLITPGGHRECYAVEHLESANPVV